MENNNLEYIDNYILLCLRQYIDIRDTINLCKVCKSHKDYLYNMEIFWIKKTYKLSQKCNILNNINYKKHWIKYVRNVYLENTLDFTLLNKLKNIKKFRMTCSKYHVFIENSSTQQVIRLLKHNTITHITVCACTLHTIYKNNKFRNILNKQQLSLIQIVNKNCFNRSCQLQIHRNGEDYKQYWNSHKQLANKFELYDNKIKKLIIPYSIAQYFRLGINKIKKKTIYHYLLNPPKQCFDKTQFIITIQPYFVFSFTDKLKDNVFPRKSTIIIFAKDKHQQHILNDVTVKALKKKITQQNLTNKFKKLYLVNNLFEIKFQIPENSSNQQLKYILEICKSM